MQFGVVDRRLAVLGADDDQSGIVDALAPQFGDDLPERLVDKIELGGETRCRIAENADITAIYRRPVCYDRAVFQFFADADGLIVEAEKCGTAARFERSCVKPSIWLITACTWSKS